MSATQRMLLLVALLALSAAAVLWDRLGTRPAVGVSAAVERARPAAQPARASTRAAESPGPAAATAVMALRSRDAWGPAVTDAFQPAARARPVARATLPATPGEPARASAPALPFTVLGKKFERGSWEVYLASGDQVHIARMGQPLTDNYRVEAIAPSEIRLIYLPLNERQTLQTGASFHD
jgi:hypothetical protein